MTSQILLAAEALSWWFDPDSPPVLYNANVSVAPGELVAIVGESGTGKSTLLRAMSGLLQLRLASGKRSRAVLEGSVSFRGTLLSRPDRAFGYVPQNFQASLAPWLSASENVLMALGESRIGHGHRSTAVDLLAATGIADAADLNVRQLSGGQQQRVAICRALARGPEVLFMDEPFANLDPGLRPSITGILRELSRARRLSLLLVTHDIEAAVTLATRIVGFRRGLGLPEQEEWHTPYDRSEIEGWIGAQV